MNHIKTLAIAVITTGLVTGCASTSPEQKKAYEQAMADAEASYQKVYAVHYAWRDSADMMKEAKEAAEKGEIDKATKLANMSRTQSDLAYQQYLEQKNAGETGIR